MSREARKLSKSGFYHIVFRGINHQNIFEEEQDYEYMLEILKNLKQEIQFEIHAYGGQKEDRRDVPFLSTK